MARAQQPMLMNLVRSFRGAWNSPRWRWALLVAALSDALGLGFVLLLPMQWLLDVVTAIVLFAVLGFRWPLLSALAIEAVPGLQLFPAWTLVVVVLASADAQRTPQSPSVVEQVRPSKSRGDFHDFN